jgi:subtilisin family serine protease
MLVARVFDDAFGSSASSEIDRAIEWCADNGANIINLSLGSSSQSSNQKALVTSLYEEENILLVAAAGNHGSTSNMYPASYSSVISVGSIDEDLSRSSFSNYNSNIDLVAPGNMILSLTTGTTIVLINGAGQRMTARIMQFSSRLSTSGLYGSTVSCGLGLSTCANARGKICVVQRGQVTFNTKAKNCQLGGGIGLILYNNVEGSLQGTLVSNGGVTIPCVTVSLDASTFVQQSLFMNMKTLDYNYGELSGTSMAAPHITGVIAKVWSARPRCTNKQVRAAVEHTARYVGQQNEYGRGLAQAVDAYRYLLNQPFPCGTDGGTTSAFDYDTHEADVDITIGQFSESQAQSAGGGRRRVSEETNRTAVSEDTEPVFL